MGNSKYKQKHRELGLCINCSEPVYSGIFCLKHLRSNCVSTKKYEANNIEKCKEHDTIKRQRRRDNGQCTNCSAPLDPDADENYILCVNCRGRIHRERLIHGTNIV